MVSPPAIDAGPVLKETNVDQKILFDLFKVEQTAKAKKIITDTAKIFNINKVDEIASFRGFEEEEDDHDPEIENIDLAEFPDLFEHEEMIGWDEIPEVENLTNCEKKFYSSTQNKDIDEG